MSAKACSASADAASAWPASRRGAKLRAWDGSRRGTIPAQCARVKRQASPACRRATSRIITGPRVAGICGDSDRSSARWARAGFSAPARATRYRRVCCGSALAVAMAPRAANAVASALRPTMDSTASRTSGERASALPWPIRANRWRAPATTSGSPKSPRATSSAPRNSAASSAVRDPGVQPTRAITGRSVRRAQSLNAAWRGRPS